MTRLCLPGAYPTEHVTFMASHGQGQKLTPAFVIGATAEPGAEQAPAPLHSIEPRFREPIKSPKGMSPQPSRFALERAPRLPVTILAISGARHSTNGEANGVCRPIQEAGSGGTCQSIFGAGCSCLGDAMTTRAPVSTALSTAQNTAPSGEDLAALEADLGRLNEVAPGLGDRAVGYAAGGADTSVLMEITGIGPAALEPFTQYHGVRNVERKELRRRALVDVKEWRPAVLHRFAVLLETMQSRAGRYRYGKVDPKAPSWLAVLIEEVEQIARFGNGMDPAPSVKRFFSVPRLAELVVMAGGPEAALLHHFYGPSNYTTDRFSRQVDGLVDYLAAHAELVAVTLPHLHADGRERLMHDLGRSKIGTGAFFDIVFASAVGTSKTVRKAARAILQEAPADRLLGKAAETLASGSTDERRETVELLAMLVGAPARDTLAAHSEREKSKPVYNAIAAALVRIGA